MATVGALDVRPSPDRNAARDVTSLEHFALARQLAAESCVLLKNDGVLPLKLEDGEKLKIALVGQAASAKSAIFGGGGSGAVVPKNPVAIQDALDATKKFDVSFVDGHGPPAAIQELVAGADIGIVVLAQTSREGRDRFTLKLDQSDLVNIAAANSGKTPIIVATISPGPFVASEWINNVSALVSAA